jgi:hypothetical protein
MPHKTPSKDFIDRLPAQRRRKGLMKINQEKNRITFCHSCPRTERVGGPSLAAYCYTNSRLPGPAGKQGGCPAERYVLRGHYNRQAEPIFAVDCLNRSAPQARHAAMLAALDENRLSIRSRAKYSYAN